MGNTHGRSGRRKGPINLAELLMAVQSGRWGFDCDVEAGSPRTGGELGDRDLKMLILKLVEKKARRGDELLEAIADKVEGGSEPGPERIYPMLNLLEDSGLIKSKETEKNGKRYRTTKAGRAELDEKLGDTKPRKRQSVRPERMDNSEERRAVKNAMRNLAGAMAQHMMAKGVDDDLLAEVAAIIEDAAERIRKI